MKQWRPNGDWIQDFSKRGPHFSILCFYCNINQKIEKNKCSGPRRTTPRSATIVLYLSSLSSYSAFMFWSLLSWFVPLLCHLNSTTTTISVNITSSIIIINIVIIVSILNYKSQPSIVSIKPASSFLIMRQSLTAHTTHSLLMKNPFHGFILKLQLQKKVEKLQKKSRAWSIFFVLSLQREWTWTSTASFLWNRHSSICNPFKVNIKKSQSLSSLKETFEMLVKKNF